MKRYTEGRKSDKVEEMVNIVEKTLGKVKKSWCKVSTMKKILNGSMKGKEDAFIKE